jgi:hypothetical protein
MIANILAALLGIVALYVFVAVALCDQTEGKPNRWCPLCRISRMRKML